MSEPKKLVLSTVRNYLGNQAIDDDTDLYSVGLDSIQTLGLVLELEDVLDVDIPEGMLEPELFRTPSTLHARLLEADVIQ